MFDEEVMQIEGIMRALNTEDLYRALPIILHKANIMFIDIYS